MSIQDAQLYVESTLGTTAPVCCFANSSLAICQRKGMKHGSTHTSWFIIFDITSHVSYGSMLHVKVWSLLLA